MQFIKLIVFAIIFEYLCCLGIIEREKPKITIDSNATHKLEVVKIHDTDIPNPKPAASTFQISIQ